MIISTKDRLLKKDTNLLVFDFVRISDLPDFPDLNALFYVPYPVEEKNVSGKVSLENGN
jgi:hypothetical protein